jgi:hypothetical protein
MKYPPRRAGLPAVGRRNTEIKLMSNVERRLKNNEVRKMGLNSKLAPEPLGGFATWRAYYFSSRKGAETQRNRGPLLPQVGTLIIASKELKTT